MQGANIELGLKKANKDVLNVCMKINKLYLAMPSA